MKDCAFSCFEHGMQAAEAHAAALIEKQEIYEATQHKLLQDMRCNSHFMLYAKLVLFASQLLEHTQENLLVSPSMPTSTKPTIALPIFLYR